MLGEVVQSGRFWVRYFIGSRMQSCVYVVTSGENERRTSDDLVSFENLAELFEAWIYMAFLWDV